MCLALTDSVFHFARNIVLVGYVQKFQPFGGFSLTGHVTKWRAEKPWCIQATFSRTPKLNNTAVCDELRALWADLQLLLR
jgi:hypothetical protein